MALDANIVWEVRTTGSQNNGGGFKTGATGTDYSQQDSAEDNGTDLACADGDAASPEITSATHNFVDADVGNIIHITAGTGWTAGWYEIVSVAANAATLDRACGTDGAKTNGTWYLGGAFKLGGSLDADFFSSSSKTARNKIYFESGTYTFSTEDVGMSVGVDMIGYDSVRDDTPTGDDRPLISGTKSFATASATAISVRNMIFTSSTASNTFINNETDSLFVNCKFTNTSGGASSAAFDDDSESTLIGCEAINADGWAFDILGTKMFFCYAHDSSVGINIPVAPGTVRPVIVGCVIDTCTTGISGVANANINCLVNNTIYNCTTGISITPLGTTYVTSMFNNIISECTTGLSASGTSTKLQYMDFNCWYNTTDISGSQFSKGSNAVSEDPEMSSPSTGIFTIGSDSEAANEALDASTYTSCSV